MVNSLMPTQCRIVPWFNLMLIAALTGCSEEPPIAPERVRAIKSYTVTEPAGGDVRRYAGTVVAADTSSLSFAASGTIQTVAAKQGERVTAGQVLATLDPRPYELDVEAARSQLQSAQASFNNKQQEQQRQATLYKKRLVARVAYDESVAAAEIAEGDLNVARSRLAQAERDLDKATLAAPFDGVIATRQVEPFVEVTAGQMLFEINSEGAMEIAFAVPDVAAGRFGIGLPVSVDVATVDGCGCPAKIIEIGAAADTANAVSVKAAFVAAPSALLPGTAAEVTVVLTGESEAHGFLVPLVAIAPGDDQHEGYVFKFSPETGTVQKVPIKGGEGRENLIEVVDGVASGDVIAAAGVSFLRDGQEVTLLDE